MKFETLCIKNLSKKLNEGYELKSISIRVFEGEILGIFGHSDSGVLTLSGVLAGEIPYDEGSISLFEKTPGGKSLDALIKAGMSHIGPDSKLYVEFTVAESLCTIYPPILDKVWINRKMMKKKAEEIASRYHLNIDLMKKTYQLTAYEKNIVEILRSVVNGCKVIMLENTFHLYDHQGFNDYFRLLKELAAEGRSIVIIGTDFKSPVNILDRLITIHNGTVQGVFHQDMFDAVTIDGLRHYDKKISKTEIPREEKHHAVLQMKNIEFSGCKIDHVCINSGEVVGFIDNGGNAFYPIVRLFNGQERYRGEIFLNGRLIKLRSQSDAVRNGIGFITKYDDKCMLFDNLTIADNILMMKFREYSRLGFISKRWYSFALGEYFTEHKIPAHFSGLLPSQVDAYTRALIPRIRWDSVKPKLVVMSNLFVGMDSMMRTALYEYIDRLKAKGIGIALCLFSGEELMNICDRVYVAEQNISSRNE
jgi:ABC-type sugar transport system ATPase subunit